MPTALRLAPLEVLRVLTDRELADSVNIETAARACGDCHVCCVHLPIPPGAVGFHEKPAGLACPKLCQSGCSIYQQRPKLCKEFECTWLANKDWPEAWRPDRSGLFCLQEEVARDIRIGLIYELETEALGTDLAEEIIGTLLARSVAVVLVDRHGHRRTTINRAYAEEIENFGQDAGGGPSRESHFTAWLRAKMAGTAPASPERRAA